MFSATLRSNVDYFVISGLAVARKQIKPLALHSFHL
jgi:hypothetical protein